MRRTGRKLEAASLRRKAEAQQRNKTAHQVPPLSEGDAKKLIHELVVHQIELKMQNEELLRAQSAAQEIADKYIELYELSPSGYVTLSKTGEIHQINIACARILGRERSHLLHHPFRLLVSLDSRPAFDHFIQTVIDTNAPAACEVIVPRSGTQPAFVQLTGILSTHGEQLLITLVDVTQRKEMDQLMRDVQRREAIGVLSAGIAHDFNNLLAVMMGNVSLAQIKVTPQHPAYRHLENAELAMKRAAELTNQILAYSGKGKNRIETVDLCEEIRQHVSLFTISVPKNVKLTTHLPSTPVFVCGDPGQIKQIIMNLISNGADSIGERQGTVSITLNEVALRPDELSPYGRITNAILKEGTYALLEIRDTGAGMSEKTLASIFDPFFTTKFTGRGLGLSAVLGIIRGHEGGIAIASAVGAGSTFRVILPVCDAHAEETVPHVEMSDPEERTKTTILVIDDEPDVAAMAKEVLESLQYAVIAEVDPRRGIDLYRRHQTDIRAVLLDWTMPELSGKDVAEALALIDPAVKIIISSGYSPDEIKAKIGTPKVSGYLQKPYSMQALLSVVESVLK